MRDQLKYNVIQKYHKKLLNYIIEADLLKSSLFIPVELSAMNESSPLKYFHVLKFSFSVNASWPRNVMTKMKTITSCMSQHDTQIFHCVVKIVPNNLNLTNCWIFKFLLFEDNMKV